VAEHPVDVVTQVTADHRAVEALFSDLEAGRGDRAEVIRVIVRELSLHAGVEELVVYPVARKRIADGDQLVDHDLEEHQALKKVLVRLDGTDPQADSTARDLDEAKRLVSEHVSHEESELLPKLTTALDDGERAELGDLFLKGKEHAPTHPHPHAPNTPPFNAIADAVAALLDKARDAVHHAKK